MTSDDKRRIEMYYISGFKKIDRKIYQIFGKKIGRAIPIKSIVYFIVVFGIVFLLRHLPIINLLFLKIPFLVSYLLIPVVASYLLADMGTEKRTVLSYIRSIVNYQLRKRQRLNFYRGKLVASPQTYSVKGHARIVMSELRANRAYKGKRYKVRGFVTYR
ncbi:TcpE family conjugal transfer membrane protein [Bacillus sp. FJAT-47783]|uniref:TcpE family conjugal transfer membrane protein n=1 Tax=Bacillus sp. FJAT-47783 TaxID=2922712 RepID=UPI001FACCC98|nr:TcpE family conjugal transfer membrane protein [Bacillus sp. FJAT-47783]